MLSRERLALDVDSLLKMFQMDQFSFSGNDLGEKRRAFQKMIQEEKLYLQLDDVCQFSLKDDYSKNKMINAEVDHFLSLRVNQTLISFVLCTERRTELRYMEVDVLCAREHSHTGKFMLKAAENLALSKGIGIMSLASIPPAVFFYEKMGYSPSLPEDCGKFNILDIQRDALSLLELPRKHEKDGTVHYMDSQVTKLLEFFEHSKQSILYLMTEYEREFDEWNRMLIPVDMIDLIRDGNLVMSKFI